MGSTARAAAGGDARDAEAAQGPAPAGVWWRPGRVAPYLVLLLGWLAALPLTMHYGNPDGPAYVLVAERWLAGDLPAAINAYWGPLLPWLSAPLLAIGVGGLLALRLVLLAGALLTLAPLRNLCRRAGASRPATDVLLLAAAPLLVYNALFGLYADVLMAAALLRAVDLLLRPEATSRVGLALRAGMWAGVAYLARAYAVPVALAVLPLGAALHLRPLGGVGPRVAARTSAVALAGFLVVAGPWAATLSAVYGHPTFSTSAAFNAELVAPGSAGNPFNVPGLHEPTRPDGISAWEEPSRLEVPLRRSAEEAGATETGERDAGHLTQMAVANARIVAGSVARRGAPVAVLALVALGWHLARRRWPSPALAGTVALSAVSAGGLLLIIAIERYLWLPILALVPAAALGLDVLRGRWPRVAVGAGGALVLVMAAASVHGLSPRVGEHREVTRAADVLGDRLEGARVATAQSWQRSHLLCHHADCQYLGRPPADDPLGAMREMEVDQLVVWRGDEDELADLPPTPDDADLTGYRITPGGAAPTWAVVGDELVTLDAP